MAQTQGKPSNIFSHQEVLSRAELKILLTPAEMRAFFPDIEGGGHVESGARETPTEDGRRNYVRFVPSQGGQAHARHLLDGIIGDANPKEMKALESFLETVVRGERKNSEEQDLDENAKGIFERRLEAVRNRKAGLSPRVS